MLVVMKAQATPEEIQAVCNHIVKLGFRPHSFSDAGNPVVGITGNHGDAGREELKSLPGVAEVRRIAKAYKLASREVKAENTVIGFAGSTAAIGGHHVTVIAGPRAIESREQTLAVAEQVAAAGAQFFSGGVFAQHPSSGTLQQQGLEALHILAEVREKFGLRTVMEAFDSETLRLAEAGADIVAIGARNMQNFALLRKAGQIRKPVLIRRSTSATLEELLMAAEYVMSEGNHEVILCEQGVRGFAGHAENTLDLGIIPALRHETHLPVLADPCQDTGNRNSILPMARAAVAAGADGVMAEIQNPAETTHSEETRSIDGAHLAIMMNEIEQIAPVAGRHLTRGAFSTAAQGAR